MKWNIKFLTFILKFLLVIFIEGNSGKIAVQKAEKIVCFKKVSAFAEVFVIRVFYEIVRDKVFFIRLQEDINGVSLYWSALEWNNKSNDMLAITFLVFKEQMTNRNVRFNATSLSDRAKQCVKNCDIYKLTRHKLDN